jgi:hypothetical protein
MVPSLKRCSFFFTCLAISAGAGSALADEPVVIVGGEDPAPPVVVVEPSVSPAGRVVEPPTASPPGGVVVHLHADDPRATLERRSKVETYAGLPIKDAAIAGVATWTPECVAPCEVAIDPKYAYRVGGDGLVPSSTFTLPRTGDVTVDAQMGSAYKRLGGLALFGVGAGGMVLGVAALAVSPVLASDNVGSSGVRTGILVSGAALTSLSALVLGAGLWLWAQNDTKVHPDPMRGIVF